MGRYSNLTIPDALEVKPIKRRYKLHKKYVYKHRKEKLYKISLKMNSEFYDLEQVRKLNYRFKKSYVRNRVIIVNKPKEFKEQCHLNDRIKRHRTKELLNRYMHIYNAHNKSEIDYRNAIDDTYYGDNLLLKIPHIDSKIFKQYGYLW